MAVYRGQDGELVWRVEDRSYSGPCIIHNDIILTNVNSYSISSGAFSLLDGSPKLIMNPLTQEPQEWQLCRAYGCNSIIASENLLTFRSGAAGFYDLETLSGTGNLGGFKSGCTSNLVVANGVLNAPDYTRTCSCGYQNQTSLALVHMPEMELWTVNDVARLSKPGQPIRRLGVNFGAPGDRVDSDGTLWIDYPTVGGDSVDLPIRVTGNVEYYHHNSLKFSGAGLPWVGASGIEDCREIVIPLAVKGQANELLFRVQDGKDDAEEQEDGSVNLDSSDLEFVKDKGPQTIGIRFDHVEIPAGQKIERAYIQFVCDESTSEPTSVVIRAEDTDHAEGFSSSPKNVSARKLLAPTITWSIPEWGKVDQADAEQQSPDVTELVQTLVQRPDWKSGNAIGFQISGQGHRVAKAYDGAAADAPTLVVSVEAVADRSTATAHTVRLQFAEPEDLEPGQRVFDVVVGDRVVETDFDVVREAGAPRTTIVREYHNIMLDSELTIKFHAKQGRPVLAGVEVFRPE